MLRVYKIKKFSRINKTYTLKRKTFAGVIDTAGNVVNKTVGTAENVAGGVATGTGKAMDSFVGKAAGIGAGSLAGLALAPKIGAAALGPIGAGLGILAAPTLSVLGGIAGHAAMKGGGSILKGVGESLKDDAAQRV